MTAGKIGKLTKTQIEKVKLFVKIKEATKACSPVACIAQPCQ